MNTPNFNFQELHDFLFEPASTTATKMESQQFDFEHAWNGLHVNAIQKPSDNSMQQPNSLSAFIGDLSHAAAAVVAAESPMISTPFLDHSCMNTPFTPASVFTPSLAQLKNSPFYSTYINNNNTTCFGNISTIDNRDDIQVATYLNNDMSWQDNNSSAATAIPAADLFTIHSTELFNGNPSQLLLNNVPAAATTSYNDESSDFLFPPLPSDSQDVSYSYNANPTQDLDTSNLFDDCFDDCFFDQVNMVPEVVVQPVIENKAIVSKKRKNDDLSVNKNKRIKITPTVSNEQDHRKFECDVCHAAFNRRFNLGTHMKTHDKNRRKDFPCHLCQKFFDRKHDLTRHISTVHNGERAYACDECLSTFSRKDAMVRHRLQKHNHHVA